MEEAAVATIERGIALGGAIIVGTAALTALATDWSHKGADSQVTKIMMGLMALGCVLVVLAAFKVLGA